MSAMLAVACPECHKELKVPAELAGKKVRCKGCGATFPVQAKAEPRPPAKPKGILDDDGPAQFGFKEEEKAGVARCPACAGELESENAVLCLHCGFNLRTRQKVESRKVIETTSGDYVAHLLPGFAALAFILILIGLNLFYLLKLEAMVKDGDWEWLTYRGFKVWVVIISLFIAFFAGKFAVGRLILNPHPPERKVG